MGLRGSQGTDHGSFEVTADTINVLFICSRNQWRSPTAEALYRQYPGITARSAGTSPSARIRVSERLLAWANMVFVMEKRHGQILRERFGHMLGDKTVICLDIPDDYQFMDEDLVATLKDRLRPHIPVPDEA